jgi:hypothetical protein
VWYYCFWKTNSLILKFVVSAIIKKNNIKVKISYKWKENNTLRWVDWPTKIGSDKKHLSIKITTQPCTIIYVHLYILDIRTTCMCNDKHRSWLASLFVASSLLKIKILSKNINPHPPPPSPIGDKIWYGVNIRMLNLHTPLY